MLDAIRKHVAWDAIPAAAIAAGTAFLLATVFLTPVFADIDRILPLRYTAGLVLGDDAVTDAGAGVVLVGIVVHYALSFVFTLVITIVIHRGGFMVWPGRWRRAGAGALWHQYLHHDLFL